MKADREEKQRIAAVNTYIYFTKNINQLLSSIIWVLLKQHERKKWNDQKQLMLP